MIFVIKREREHTTQHRRLSRVHHRCKIENFSQNFVAAEEEEEGL
jgi:hypothetical protein